MYHLSESKIKICDFTINKKNWTFRVLCTLLGLAMTSFLKATINYDLDMKDRFTP